MKKVYLPFSDKNKELIDKFAGNDKNLCYIEAFQMYYIRYSRAFLIAISSDQTIYINNCQPWDWEGEPKLIKILPEEILKIKIHTAYWFHMILGFALSILVFAFAASMFPSARHYVAEIILLVTALYCILANLIFPCMKLTILTSNPLCANIKRGPFFSGSKSCFKLKLNFFGPSYISKKCDSNFTNFIKFEHRVKKFSLYKNQKHTNGR
ncbi:MAG: hypothetical protein HFE62_03725 [Firmicutes bacterium]|nr:hypothetical protein [Bacillota bacterium]